MEQRETIIGQKKVLMFEMSDPQVLLVQTLGRHEVKTIGREAEMIRSLCDVPFVMAAFDIADWDRELTPWPDPEVSRRKAVGIGADATLRYVVEDLLLSLPKLPTVLGGYSLGGLFSLWASSRCARFAAIAACSPSLWISDWLPFAHANPTMARSVYLSLGDHEEMAKNKAVARVGDCVRAEYELLKTALGADRTTLQWERGGHFTDGDGRMARGFAWCVNRLADK